MIGYDELLGFVEAANCVAESTCADFLTVHGVDVDGVCAFARAYASSTASAETRDEVVVATLAGFEIGLRVGLKKLDEAFGL